MSLQFFNLLARVAGEGAVDGPALERLLRQVAQQIERHPVTERSPADEDALLLGLLRLGSVILRRSPALAVACSGLATHLADVCLFARTEHVTTAAEADAARPPKCKAAASRAAALDLLLELVRAAPSALLELASSNWRELEAEMAAGLPFGYNPAAEALQARGGARVGLKNLGNICYMSRRRPSR